MVPLLTALFLVTLMQISKFVLYFVFVLEMTIPLRTDRKQVIRYSLYI